MIQQSFQSWSDSPIKTTIETLPISAIKSPKIIVCPPPDTYTNLNPDVVETEPDAAKVLKKFFSIAALLKVIK